MRCSIIASGGRRRRYLRQTNAILLARGLGSSAAAIAGGFVVPTRSLAIPLGDELVDMATAFEGHPTTSPCLVGTGG